MTASPASPSIVLCPLNGRFDAERAIPTACDAARTLGAALLLYSAVEDQHMVSRQKQYLEETAAQLADPPPGGVQTEVVVNPHAPWAIANVAARPDVLAVMATSTSSSLHSGYLGSAAERVARDASNPVLLCGPKCETRLSDVERVVVACDGSTFAEQALPVAQTWADKLDVAVWVVTCLSPTSHPEVGQTPASEATYVRRVATELDAQWETLHGPDPAEAIAQWAGPALTVVTTHGRSGLTRLRLGSVATRLTRLATGPVLVANGHAGIHNVRL